MNGQGEGTAFRPQREIELIAGTPAGGGQDRPARALIEVLTAQKLVEVPVTLTNIPGRGGSNAWEHLASRAGDPHVLAISSPPFLSNRLVGISALGHADLTPVANLYTEDLLFAARAGSDIRSGADVLDRLRIDPASLSVAFATAIGNMNHIALAMVARAAGGDPKALNVSIFDSARYAIADVVEGKADLAIVTATSAAPELAAGTLRGIAVSATKRLGGAFADTPTWQEQGVDCVAGTWRGLFGAPGLDAAQVAFWENALATATRSEAWRAELERHNWTDSYLGAAETRALLDRDDAEMARALDALGLIPEGKR